MITPSQLAKSDTEHAHQKALFAWAAVACQHGFDVAEHWAETGNYALAKSFHVGKYIKPLKWLHAIPNGGSRGDNAQSRAIRGAQMKAEGVRSGVADVFLPWPSGGFMGLYIEMKKPSEKPVRATSKGGLSDAQIEFGQDMKAAGYGWICCYSWREAVDVIRKYLEQDNV